MAVYNSLWSVYLWQLVKTVIKFDFSSFMVGFLTVECVLEQFGVRLSSPLDKRQHRCAEARRETSCSAKAQLAMLSLYFFNLLLILVDFNFV